MVPRKSHFPPYSESYYTKQGVATSQSAIIRLATKVLLAKFSHLETRKIGPLALQAWQDELVAQGLARTEVNRRARLIRKMFKWGVTHSVSMRGLCDFGLPRLVGTMIAGNYEVLA
jgi:hypothetical protein